MKVSKLEMLMLIFTMFVHKVIIIVLCRTCTLEVELYFHLLAIFIIYNDENTAVKLPYVTFIIL